MTTRNAGKVLLELMLFAGFLLGCVVLLGLVLFFIFLNKLLSPHA